MLRAAEPMRQSSRAREPQLLMLECPEPLLCSERLASTQSPRAATGETVFYVHAFVSLKSIPFDLFGNAIWSPP